MNTKSLFFSIVLIIFTVFVGRSVYTRFQAKTIATTQGKSPLQVTQPQYSGKFRVEYRATQNRHYADLQQVFQESKMFETVTGELNKSFALPVSISVILTECGGAENAFYDQQSHQIFLCYELIDQLSEVFEPYTKSDAELGNTVLQSAFFIFLHEMGHALVDVLKIPATGKEEDAVDQLATLILIEGGKEGEEAALNAASWFLLRGEKQTRLTELKFWDEHSLDQQRFYDIVCWIYGHNPEQYADFITEGLLPEERALGCKDEYQKIFNAWNVLLSPYSKNEKFFGLNCPSRDLLLGTHPNVNFPLLFEFRIKTIPISLDYLGESPFLVEIT